MFIFKPIGGMYRESQGIKMIARPRDISLYRSILPEQFLMPKQPAVFLFVADYLKITPWPFKILPWSISRYQEAAVCIKGSYKGIEGWFCLDMPISNWIAMALGRYLMGFPKYVVDKISLEKKDINWYGCVEHKGKTIFRLNFSKGLKNNLSPWEEKILNNKSFFEDIFYLLLPAEKGPGVNKVSFEEVVPPQWSPELGMVDVSINSNAPWAKLIETDKTYPGMYSYFVGRNNLLSVKLD